MKNEIISNTITAVLMGIMIYVLSGGNEQLLGVVTVAYTLLVIVGCVSVPIVAILITAIECNHKDAGRISKSIEKVSKLNLGVKRIFNTVKSIISIGLMIACGYVAIPVIMIILEVSIFFVSKSAKKWIDGYNEHLSENI